MRRNLAGVLLLLILAFFTHTDTQAAASVIESFENTPASWVITSAASGGSVTRDNLRAASGSYSARMFTTNSGNSAYVYQKDPTFSDRASDHQWQERTSTYHWQRASIYLPSSTVTALGAGEYLPLAGMWASTTMSTGWFLRVGQNGALSVSGKPDSSAQAIFNAYDTFPQNQWVELEIGLHSQAGPGVKRAFAFLINGKFYGWYRQGQMSGETYNRAAMGIISTNSASDLVVHVDQWRAMTAQPFPDGPDTRSTAKVQEQDFRSMNGVQVQHDWSTWKNNPTLHPTYGLYTPNDRLQSGRNIDRMPNLANGWAEIEIDWPNGTPSYCSGYCSAMVGFRKEVNREHNLEFIPYGENGVMYLAFEAWLGEPIIMQKWRLPDAADASANVPEPGDIIRARFEQVGTNQIRARASYYDASAVQWYTDIIDHTFNATVSKVINGSTVTVNYLDGYHNAVSITIDSPRYSIRRFKLGTLDTYPGTIPGPETPTPLSPATGSTTTNVRQPIAWSSQQYAARYEVQFDDMNPPQALVYSGTATTYIPPAPLLYRNYYWRVRAVGMDNSPTAWSEIYNFTLSPAAHAAPARNYFTTTQPTLTWSRVSWADSYWLQVDDDTFFTNPVYTNDSLNFTTLFASVPPLDDGYYYYRVRARRPDGMWGAWSVPEGFIVTTT